MLDFETLDVGECPIILSMGACVFNEDGIIDTLFQKINTSSCQVIGCTESLSTTLWWEKQSDEARNAAFGGDTNIGYAMGMLVDFYKKNDCKEIWSKGSIADIRWANNILNKLKIDQPWEYYQEMCFRTFLKMSQPIEIPFEGNKHNALDDAIHQAKIWIQISKNNYARNEICLNNVNPKPSFNDIYIAINNFKSNEINVEIDILTLCNPSRFELNVYFQHFSKIDDEKDKYSYKRFIHSDFNSDDLYISEVLKAFELFTNNYFFESSDWDDYHIIKDDMPF
jgi:hypothetical protein